MAKLTECTTVAMMRGWAETDASYHGEREPRGNPYPAGSAEATEWETGATEWWHWMTENDDIRVSR